MSRQAETDSKQIVVDSLEFAREGGRLAGEVAVAALGRLADLLADASGTGSWELQGERTDDGKSWLALQVRGSVNLRCQRCLGALPYPVAVDSRLLLVPPGGVWPEELQDGGLEDETSDAIAAERALAVVPLVEEEVLLALPIAPRHEDCDLPLAVAEEQEPSPFAALAKLKH